MNPAHVTLTIHSGLGLWQVVWLEPAHGRLDSQGLSVLICEMGWSQGC